MAPNTETSVTETTSGDGSNTETSVTETTNDGSNTETTATETTGEGTGTTETTGTGTHGEIVLKLLTWKLMAMWKERNFYFSHDSRPFDVADLVKERNRKRSL